MMRRVGAHERRRDQARRSAQRTIVEIGREIRQARLDHDLSIAECASVLCISTATWSRLERGLIPNVSAARLIEAGTVVGLDVGMRAYPGGAPHRDRPHLDLLERLRAILGEAVRWQTEVPLPIPGDRRAWDALVRVPRARVGIEAETRARDAQALQRRLMLKQRDGGVDHVILLLSDTRHNRSFVRGAGSGFLAEFPIPGPVVIDRLRSGRDPGGSSILLV